MFTSAFWKGTAERAIKTFAQALGAYLLAGATGVLTADWGNGFSIAGMATVLSILTSIGSGPASPVGTPSLVDDRDELPTR